MIFTQLLGSSTNTPKDRTSYPRFQYIKVMLAFTDFKPGPE